MAARNSGGIVIVQVERIAERGSLNPRQVQVPGVLVDCVVVADRPEHHMQTFPTQYSPPSPARSACRCRQSVPMPMGERKIIARRAAMGCSRMPWWNLGIGMPEGIAYRGRGKGHRPADAHRRARRGRRHSRRRAELRRRR